MKTRLYCRDLEKANPAAAVECCDSCHEDENGGLYSTPSLGFRETYISCCCRWFEWLDTSEGQSFLESSGIVGVKK